MYARFLFFSRSGTLRVRGRARLMVDPSRNSLETPTSISRHNVYKLASTERTPPLVDKLPPRVYKRSRVLRARYATILGRAWNLRFVSTHLKYRRELRVVLHS